MASNKKIVNEELATRKVMKTNDHDRFKVLAGNRQVNKQHVNHLIKLMTDNGNLTDKFPIVVSKDGYVIDGQHRLKALKTLGWDVGYIIEENATIETVRNINRGNRNWNWRDVAESYADLGNDEYVWFLDFFNKHKLTYTLAMLFCSAKLSKRWSSGETFNTGDFKVEDKLQAEKFAQQYEELRDLVDITSHDFGKALNKIFRSPFYNHERMVLKMEAQGHTLPAKANESDYRRDIEAIFNFGYPDDNKTRLF